MIPFDDALRQILAAAQVMGSERVALGAAAGRVLAEELIAHTPLPTFDYSAMDGYAVARRDFEGDGPWIFSVRGESRAGGPPITLERNSVCRIFTGAPLPAGADSVVMQEDVVRERELAKFEQRPPLGSHIRRRGDDLREGAVALASGTRLSGFHLGLAAAVDRSELLVARKPRVAILCTGEELRAPGSLATPGSVPDSNGPSLAALVANAGGTAELMPRTRDDMEATQEALRSALQSADLLLTVGGVSVGEHDLVRAALTNIGAELEFWKVQIKPGKPLAFGRFGHTRILGLPGNPVSAQLTFSLFGVPLIRAMQGDRKPLPPRSRARLAQDFRQKPGRTSFYRATLAGDTVDLAQNQASGSTASLAYADALVIVPAETEQLAAGEWVELIRLAEL